MELKENFKEKIHLKTEQINALPESLIKQMVMLALNEDIQSGDITAKLIDKNKETRGKLITREGMVLCGQSFVNEVFKQIDPEVQLTWYAKDGDVLTENAVIFEVSGKAQSILTAERTALNFLQMLSATATKACQFSNKINHTNAKILDTRKTIPLYRLAQKYAVHCGGGFNHRIGLFDAFLIKENHILAAGSIFNAVQKAREIAKDKLIEVEVENFDELNQAINAKVDVIMLDNFNCEQMKEAVKIVDGQIPLEASGNVSLDSIVEIAETGVDFISIGGLTKHIQAIDLSLRLEN